MLNLGLAGRVQDLLGRRIAIENVSYYTPLGGEMGELEFINAVLAGVSLDGLPRVAREFVNNLPFTCGLTVHYPPSALTGEATHQHLATGFIGTPVLLPATLAAGTYSITAKATDNVGGTATSAVSSGVGSKPGSAATSPPASCGRSRRCACASAASSDTSRVAM